MKYRQKRTTRRKTRKRRNPSVALMGNPSPKRRRRTYRRSAPKRRYRRNPGFIKTGKLVDTVKIGVTASLGVMAATGITNIIANMMSGSSSSSSVSGATTTTSTMTTAQKNWLSLGVAVGLGFIAPKLRMGKYGEAFATGAIAISVLNIAKTSFSLPTTLTTLSGDSDAEIDKIIANLDVQGANDEDDAAELLGISEVNGNVELLGIAEALSGMESEDDDY